MECYKRLLVTIISLLKSFLRPFLFFFFFLFLKRRKKKKKKKNQSTRTLFHCSSLDEFPKYVADNYSRLALRSKKKRRDVVHSIPRSGIRFPRSPSSRRRATLATGLHRDSFVQSPPLSRPLFHPFHEPLSARHLTTLAVPTFRFFFP